MTNLVAGISRYLIILLITIYTYYNFRFFSMKDEEGRNRAVRRQLICMFMLHFLANLVIFLNTDSRLLAAFYCAQLLFFAGYLSLYRLFYRNVSRLLLNNTCMLLCTSFIMLTRLNPNRAIRQFVIAALAAAVTLVIPFMIDRVWQLASIPWLYAALGLTLLLAVFFSGDTSYGARLSLHVGGFSVQPSEFVKISFVFFIAAMFYRSSTFKNVVLTTAAAALHVLLLTASKDLGGALIYFIAYLAMLFVATSNTIYLGLGLGGGAGASVMAYRLFPHVRRRVDAWTDPWKDVADSGYQTAQALFAIGTGGWFGVGLYQGMPEKIPVVDKDFLFAAVAEELGGLYALCLLLICLGCFLQFMLLAFRLQAMFYKQLAVGLGTVYITQVFLTIGGVTKFIPLTGVTLPFVSYGGSSMFATFIIFGVIQGLYILKENEEDDDEEG